MDDLIKQALESINPADLTYQEWVNVGMGLKEEGCQSSLWDNWSKNDHRYKPGECARKWRGFNSSGITGATIMQMAKDRGWRPGGSRRDLPAYDWEGTEIEYDGDPNEPDRTPAEELIAYLEAVFKPDEKVGYVTSDVWESAPGQWAPGRGVSDRTAAQLIADICQKPDDLGQVLGDWKPACGAWIRFNPLDGAGVKNENVTVYRHALVESDDLSVQEQEALIRKLELPCAAIVSSGGKSIHAIVKVDAPDYKTYQERVTYLYDFCDANGLKVDRQNRNPSRLSRMPGITRNGNRQRLIAANTGRASWNDWLDLAEGTQDELPKIESFETIKERPPLPDPLIEGVLRCGHKMLIAGPSKAGKSFCLLELAGAIADGRQWLGLNVRQGKVLYVNLEIDSASVKNRIFDICEALKMSGPAQPENLLIWNLRGNAATLDQLVPKLIRRVKDENLVAVIIDPIYKVIMGDENNASEMGRFCNEFDKICAKLGCAVIYCHHFSKGAQGGKKAIDRASGSGVFARDPDAVITLTELELTDHIKANYADDGASGWLVEASLREFAPIKPFKIWFRHPLHLTDSEGILAGCGIEGSLESARSKAGGSTAVERRDKLNAAVEMIESFGDPVSVGAVAGMLEKSKQTIKNWIQKEFSDEYGIKNGIIYRKNGAKSENAKQ